ncbi:MAG: hypothetical protein LE168_05780, partial [Endomicrobium sp.]|nr:hypothetical protein [Endomicrobium sp.]
LKDFKRYITDLGDPTANTFGSKCAINKIARKCENKRYLFLEVCKNLIPGHNQQLELLRKISVLPNVKKVLISSGVKV